MPPGNRSKSMYTSTSSVVAFTSFLLYRRNLLCCAGRSSGRGLNPEMTQRPEAGGDHYGLTFALHCGQYTGRFLHCQSTSKIWPQWSHIHSATILVRASGMLSMVMHDPPAFFGDLPGNTRSSSQVRSSG